MGPKLLDQLCVLPVSTQSAALKLTCVLHATPSLGSELDAAHMAGSVLSATLRSVLSAEQQLTHHFPSKPSWYQHSEASGQQLPDTDAVGVPPSL